MYFLKYFLFGSLLSIVFIFEVLITIPVTFEFVNFYSNSSLSNDHLD